MHNNPYAWAISPRQIAKRLRLPEQLVAPFIEEEREQFGMFCKMTADAGKYYGSQLEAWRNWNRDYPPVLSWESNIQITLRWEMELRALLDQAAIPGNYNEYGGQL